MPASPFSRISFVWALFLVLAILGSVREVAASSRAPGPLKRIFHPRDISLDVLPRSIPSHPGHPLKNRKRSDVPDSLLLPSDGLRLSLSLPNIDRLNRAVDGDHDEDGDEDDRIHLHLSPTEDMIHPQAKINYLSSSGEIISSEPLFAHDRAHRLYSGEVIAQGHTDQRFQEDRIGNGGLWYDPRPSSAAQRGVRGWASVHVYDVDGDEGVESGRRPRFGGTINVDGRVWNVMTRENYERHRTELDPIVVVREEGDDENGGLVIFLEGDHHPNPRDAHAHANAREEETSTGCGHDRIEWNMDNATHPVRRPRVVPQQATPWWSSSPVDSFPDLFADFQGSRPNGNEPRRRGLVRRDDVPTGGTTNPNTNYINSIGSTSGCPSEQRVVYVGFAADCNYVGTYGGAEQARTQILTNMNSVSNLYRQTFNISLGIIELNVVNDTCATSSAGGLPWNVECSNTITLNERLSLFSQWRGSSGTPDAGLYHLATACATDTEIGVAWLGTICQTGSNQQSSGYVSGTGVSVATRSEWSLISHEMGHNFGAIHDCTSSCSLSGSCCPFSTNSCDAGQRYIMNPSTSTSDPQVNFSPCSVGNICSLMQQNALDYSCVVAPGARTVLSLQSCGNGILEDGEDCDPGSGGSSPCCDSSTCKFINGAVCDPATDACCTGQCSYASNSTLCRASVDENCDSPEYCTGTSRSCPSDRTAEDGTGCGNGLACASGQCTSNDLQCRTVGASRNLTQACNQRGDKSCVVSCQDPQSSNRCLILQSPLIDGSPCGYGGNCYNGTCSSGSVGSQISSWYTQNKNISIPVTVVGGIIILLILFAIGRCIVRGCCGGGRRSRQAHRSANRPTSSSSAAPMTQHQRTSTGYAPNHAPQYAPPPGGYPYNGQYGPGQSFGNQAPSYYGNGYAGPQQPAPIQAGREHYIDDRLYNGPNYRGH